MMTTIVVVMSISVLVDRLHSSLMRLTHREAISSHTGRNPGDTP